jgi:hypothetical protein
MDLCAKHYGVDKSFVQLFLKENNSVGLHNARIWQAEFEPVWLPWYEAKKKEIEDAGAKSKEEWQLLILAEKHRRDKRLNDEDENKIVPVAWAHAEIRAQAEAAQGVFNSIPSRMAMDLAGLKPYEIEDRLRRAIDEGIAKMGECSLPK